MRLPNPSSETKFSGANGDRELFIFPVQLTTNRIGNFTRLIHTLAICVTIHTIHINIRFCLDVSCYSEGEVEISVASIHQSTRSLR